jgi:hypothetical protein
MKAKQSDRKFDKGEDVTQFLDMSKTIALLKDSKG